MKSVRDSKEQHKVTGSIQRNNRKDENVEKKRKLPDKKRTREIQGDKKSKYSNS